MSRYHLAVEVRIISSRCGQEDSYTTKLHHQQRSSISELLKLITLSCYVRLKDHPSQSLVLGWMKIWDTALDHGPGGTTVVRSVLKLICKTAFSDRVCPMDECKRVIPTNCALPEHFLAQHTNLDVDVNRIIEKLCCCSEDLFSNGQHLSKFVELYCISLCFYVSSSMAQCMKC